MLLVASCSKRWYPRLLSSKLAQENCWEITALADPCRCPHSEDAEAPCAGACASGACAEASGILNVDKPQGWTSHDVVARVRRLAGQKRAGHAGTLDPMATGVLLVCLGQATRVSEYLMEARKLYRACVRFGTATDTYDATGTVTAQATAIPASASDIAALLPRFVGRIQQVPPPYSALKLGGEPAYRRARRGEVVSQPARPVDIYEVTLRSWSPPDLEIDVLCGRGTYIRSLAHDLGLAAGSAAHLAALQRRAVGHFLVDEALSLTELAAGSEEGNWRQYLHPLDEALLHYPALIVSADSAARLLHGQPIEAEAAAEGNLRRVYGPGGQFLALVQAGAYPGTWRPHKVFPICG